MVLNPKNSQKIMLWCADTAISLIFQAVESIGDRLRRSELSKYLRENVSDSGVSKRQISQMVYDLQRRKYIDIAEGDSVILTNKAKIRIIDQIVNTNGEDNRCRLVSFDIPEVKRSNRNNFRRAIKRMGFRQVQKSLWVSNRNIGNLVELAAIEYKVAEYVAYFISEKSNIDRHIAGLLKNNKQC